MVQRSIYLKFVRGNGGFLAVTRSLRASQGQSQSGLKAGPRSGAMDPMQHVQQPNQTNLSASKIRNQQTRENHQYQPRAQRQVEIADMHKQPAGE